MRYLFVLTVLTIAACGTTQEQEEAQARAQAQAYRNGVRNQCLGYGFKDETPEFRDCLMRIDMANRQQWEAQRQMLLQQQIYQQGVFRPR